MYTPSFNRWYRRRTKPNVQMYETAPYTTEVIGVDFDKDAVAAIKRELADANQQLELTRQYPGRQSTFDNVVDPRQIKHG